MYISMYSCICVFFIKKKLQMISGVDTKTRILSSQTNAMTTETDRGKLCSGLTLHNLAFLSLRKKTELVSDLLGRVLPERAHQEVYINAALHRHLASCCPCSSRFVSKSLSVCQDGWRMPWDMWFWRSQIKTCWAQ